MNSILFKYVLAGSKVWGKVKLESQSVLLLLGVTAQNHLEQGRKYWVERINLLRKKQGPPLCLKFYSSQVAVSEVTSPLAFNPSINILFFLPCPNQKGIRIESFPQNVESTILPSQYKICLFSYMFTVSRGTHKRIRPCGMTLLLSLAHPSHTKTLWMPLTLRLLFQLTSLHVQYWNDYKNLHPPFIIFYHSNSG